MEATPVEPTAGANDVPRTRELGAAFWAGFWQRLPPCPPHPDLN